jgi:predicted NBD/HSP70 family sugar kinase
MRIPASIAICDPARMRRINESGILRLLHEQGPLSRVELAGLLGLDRKTLTNLSRDLLQRGLVEPHNVVRSGRGRPRENLRLRADRLHAVGLHLAERRIVTALINIEGKIVEQHEVEFGDADSQKDLVRAIRDSLRTVLRQSPPDLLGVGMAIAGLVHQQERRVVESAHLKALKGVYVDKLLHGLFEGQIHVCTLTHAKLLAERWFGAARQLDHLLLVDLGVGIGCALVMGGKVQVGATHLAGEIGHSIWKPGGDICWCGRRGCLETVASLETVRAAVHRSTGLPERALTTPALARLIEQGDAVARRASGVAARAIGLVVANFVDVLNPSHVLLAGESLQLGASFLREVEESLRQNTLPALSKNLTVAHAKLCEESPLLGSGVAVFQSLFEA